MRVSMSAIGSVIMGSPARLDHARNFATQGEEPEADPAQFELAVIPARAAAHFAAAAMTDRELRRPIEFRVLTCTSHVRYSSLLLRWPGTACRGFGEARVPLRRCVPSSRS